MKLSVRVIQNDNGTFTVICPSLPGCTIRAATREEAMHRMDEAVRGYIAAVNNFVPENVNSEVVEMA